MLRNALRKLSGERKPAHAEQAEPFPLPTGTPIGIIAGNTTFPLRFAEEARKQNRPVIAVAHRGETLPAIAQAVDVLEWIRVGELGRIIEVFKQNSVTEVAMAGGINRIRLFGGVKLDARGAALLYRLRSTKDDVIMRGIAEELEREGIKVVSCTLFLQQCLVREGILTDSVPTPDEERDIQVGAQALQAMSAQDIGQLVVVRDGVVVAVEAVEGSDAAIRRGGALGGKGTVVVKFAKPTQDMRFDVPTIGEGTIQALIESKARVLALEAGRSLMMDEEKVLALANRHKIAIVGCPPLVD